jgi:uncharacterized membrane protein YkoI
MKRLVLLVAALAALAPGVADAQRRGDFGRPALGAGGDDQEKARDYRREGRHLPLAAIIARIAASTPGRQLNTEYGDRGGRTIYIIQWLTPDGRVLIFVVDAETGSILSRQGG